MGVSSGEHKGAIILMLVILLSRCIVSSAGGTIVREAKVDVKGNILLVIFQMMRYVLPFLLLLHVIICL